MDMPGQMSGSGERLDTQPPVEAAAPVTTREVLPSEAAAAPMAERPAEQPEAGAPATAVTPSTPAADESRPPAAPSAEYVRERAAVEARLQVFARRVTPKQVHSVETNVILERRLRRPDITQPAGEGTAA